MVAVFLAVLSAYGQTPASGKTRHIHAMPLNCKGSPDRVYGKSAGVYYACIKAREVCSLEKGAIPTNLIAAFDAEAGSVSAARKDSPRKGAAKKTAARQPAPLPEVKQPGVEMLRGTTVSTVDAPSSQAPAPPRTPIAEERVRAIPIGATPDEVMQKLGEPYMKISGSVEYFTYLLTSKNTAKLEFLNGKLTQLRILPAR
jgi:hypothetical protein